MRLQQQFTVDEHPGAVWKFLEQAESVAACMPGMEAIDLLDEDNVLVRVTQRIGPMGATFEAKVRVLERVEGRSIRFEAVGKSIGGAVGSVRTLNTVALRPAEGGTTVITLEGDVILAGPLGSVGQKVVARQAGKVTEEFAANMRAAMDGSAPGLGNGGAPRAVRSAFRLGGPRTRAREIPPDKPVGTLVDPGREGRWCLVAAALSTVSTGLSIAVLLRLRRATR